MSLKPLDVVYADTGIVVLNKPSGLLAVPGKTSDLCLSLQVQAQFPDALIVHRLDQATSGLMLLARSPQAQRQLIGAVLGVDVEDPLWAAVNLLPQQLPPRCTGERQHCDPR